jgi:hypothetical protein
MAPRRVKLGTADARQVAVVVVSHHDARVGVGALGVAIVMTEGANAFRLFRILARDP